MQIRLMPSSWVVPTDYDMGFVNTTGLYDELPDGFEENSIGNWWMSATDCNCDGYVNVWDVQLMYEMITGQYTPI